MLHNTISLGSTNAGVNLSDIQHATEFRKYIIFIISSLVAQNFEGTTKSLFPGILSSISTLNPGIVTSSIDLACAVCGHDSYWYFMLINNYSAIAGQHIHASNIHPDHH